jgi:hypothetical protein
VRQSLQKQVQGKVQQFRVLLALVPGLGELDCAVALFGHALFLHAL